MRSYALEVADELIALWTDNPSIVNAVNRAFHNECYWSVGWGSDYFLVRDAEVRVSQIDVYMRDMESKGTPMYL